MRLEDDNNQLRKRIEIILGEKSRLNAEVNDGKMRITEITQQANQIG